MKKLILISWILFSVSARAENKPASDCQVFIKTVGAAPNTHGSGSMSVIIKTNWIGNNEQIKKVGFFGQQVTKDLGNQESCHFSAPPDLNKKVYDHSQDFRNINYGEYRFYFPVRTGSVTRVCPGFHYTWIGTFFVETDKNTYWVNPEMNSEKYFYFDNIAFDMIERKGGWSGYSSNGISTSREDMKYYNPAQCQ